MLFALFDRGQWRVTGVMGTAVGGRGENVWPRSDLVLLFFDLLLERENDRLLHGKFRRDGHQTLVGVHYVSSKLVELRKQTD